MIQLTGLRSGYMIEITAREFFCGALGMSTGLRIAKQITDDQFTRVMEGVRQRYNIPMEDAKEMIVKLDEEFEKDSRT